MRPVSTSLKRLLPVLAFIAFASAPAIADTVVFSGALTPSSPTFNRPTPTGGALSGQNVPYSLTQLTVNVSGLYIFQSAPLACPPAMPCFNAALRLYQGSFDPANPLLNLIAGSTMEGFGPTGLGTTLQADAVYIFVTTSIGTPTYFNGQAPFINNISGPGAIALSDPPAAVPEPATMLLLGTGLAGVVAAARKRRRAKGGGEEI